MWNALVKLGDAICRRAQLRRELTRCRRLGVDVPDWLARRVLRSPSAAEDLVNFLRFLRPDEPVFLMDIGANRGEWAADFLALFPDTAVVAVEPVPATFHRLRRRFEGDPRVRPINAAVSDRPGSVTLRIGTDDTLASLYDYAAPFAAARGQTDDREAVTVEALRLDDVPTDGAEGRRRVLKIDVQGHEAAVLAGGPGLLAQTDIAIVELCFAEEYEEMEPSFAPCSRLLAEAGLYPAIFQEHGRHAMAYAIERDVIFVRRPLLDRIIG
ncbi:FkbM family methyltransferase [Azospirillum halopraeferens]|uniref:FkbM family methyltransferase n=1 Tax=Azospirillum halopraeferens TaxID=34010 RepID=UPI000427B48F|nr:FkbM family methyltransferase [Azospirillum halopraeferens]